MAIMKYQRNIASNEKRKSMEQQRSESWKWKYRENENIENQMKANGMALMAIEMA